jgi:hypothetical protein
VSPWGIGNCWSFALGRNGVREQHPCLFPESVLLKTDP